MQNYARFGSKLGRHRPLLKTDSKNCCDSPRHLAKIEINARLVVNGDDFCLDQTPVASFLYQKCPFLSPCSDTKLELPFDASNFASNSPS